MHKLIETAGRRTAGLAAGLILTGGVVGGVLLTPGTAYADPVPATPTITITNATPSNGGISVQVSVTNGTTPLGTFNVTGAGTGCNDAQLYGAPGSTNGYGRCFISSVGSGSYQLVASYGTVSSTEDTVVVPATPSTPSTPSTPGPTSGSGNVPQFTEDSPATSVDSDSYAAQFEADNSSSYELAGAPSWLSIDSTGLVSGDIPDGVTSFTYRVGAWNSSGWAWAGPFTVYCHHHVNSYANIQTWLWCTTPVFTGQHGTCTLAVSNWGPGFASDVTAQINLPWPLRADYCGYWFWFGYGCSIYGNTAWEDLGSLWPGQTKHLTVTFTAEPGWNIWGWHRGHRFTVRVDGSASAGGNFYWYWQRESYAAAWVTIIPHGYWW